MEKAMLDGKRYMVIYLEAKTIAPVYSGEIKKDRLEKSGLKRVRITGDGKVAIPIYGVLRGYLEIMLRKTGKPVCDTGKPNAIPCGKCVLCDLFGSLQKRGRAIIDDLKSVEDYNKIVKEVVHLRVDREKGTVSNTLKMEEIIEGAKFVGRIRVLDPKPDDVRLIIAGLKAIEEFGVGGWITRGRGRIKFTKIDVKEERWDKFLREAEEYLRTLKT